MNLFEGHAETLAEGARRGAAGNPYPVADILGPVRQVCLPRDPRLHPPGATVNVVARCNDREFYLPATEDFMVLLTHLREMARTYEITLYAYTMVPNHVHLPLQAPKLDALGRPLRWFMTGTS